MSRTMINMKGSSSQDILYTHFIHKCIHTHAHAHSRAHIHTDTHTHTNVRTLSIIKTVNKKEKNAYIPTYIYDMVI